MRILISAYAFSPYRGSECAVGWNIVTRMARYHDVTVLCGDVSSDLRTKHDLNRYFSEHGLPKEFSIEYIEPSKWVRLIERFHRIPGFWGLYYLAYNLWQRQAFWRARELQARSPFDVVHQLNMIGYREPGYLWKLGVPFVWGPVGGSPDEPLAYWRFLGVAGALKVAARIVMNGIQKRIAVRARIAAARACRIWAVTDVDQETITRIWGKSCSRMIETGTSYRRERFVRCLNSEEPLRIVWSGNLTPGKALPILLHSIARLCRSGSRELFRQIRVEILGDGPKAKEWKRLAVKLGVEGSLVWHGKISHVDAIRVMNQAHVVAFTSLKEGTPHVVLEALSLGLPVICHDAFGMGVAVTNKCGIKVPLKNPQTSVNGFGMALRLLVEEPERILKMSHQALIRADELSWDRKVEEMSSAYEQVRLDR